MDKSKGANTPPQLPIDVDCNIVSIKDANAFPAEFKVDIRERLATDKDLMHLIVSITEKVKSVHHGLGIRPEKLMEMLNMNTIVAVWDNTFSTGANGIFMVLNANGELVGIKPDKLLQFIRSEYGYDIITVPNSTQYAELTYKSMRLFVTSATDELVGVINARRQRTALNQRVDMFSEKSTISMHPSYADVVFQYKPLTTGDVDQIVIDMVMDDFTEHFSLFDYFIEAVIAARFAPDRRNAFMWLQACSGWGKGLLIAAFAELGLVIEMSVKEVEAAFEGKAVGASPTDFIHAWLLVIDEFKTIKSEVKQLNNTIMLSPKFQLKGKAPVYFKLFTSAEDVPSLTGSEGVESQFAKRFTYFNPSAGDLDDRAVFTQLGSGLYRRALSAGIAAIINTKVAEYRDMGRDHAEKSASGLLYQFNCEHSIANHFDSIESSIEDHVADLRELLLAYGEWLGNGEIGIPSKLITTLSDTLQRKFRNSVEVGFIGDTNVVFLNRPADAVKAWLNDRVDRGQIAKISHKSGDIIRLTNEVGSVTKTTRFHKMHKVTKVTSADDIVRKKGVAIVLQCKPPLSVTFL